MILTVPVLPKSITERPGELSPLVEFCNLQMEMNALHSKRILYLANKVIDLEMRIDAMSAEAKPAGPEEQ